MSFFENIQGVFETQFGTLPRPEGDGSAGGAGDWNTLVNRPFGYVEHYDLLKETAVTFSGSDPAIGGLALTSPLTEGKAYPVNFDGTQYLCKYESSKLGNLALEDGPDTGEPFLWYVTESMILTNAGAGTHTVSLQGDVPQKVPEEYLDPPDWNKMVNRPFGYEEKVELLQETELIFEAQEGLGGMVCAMLNLTELPSVGNKQTVIFNGVEYNCICIDGDGTALVGNRIMFDGTDTGEPFSMAIMQIYGISAIIPIDSAMTSATIQWYEYRPVPVPEKYLPEFNETVFLDFSEAGQINPGEYLDIPFNDVNSLIKAHKKGVIKVRFLMMFEYMNIFFPDSSSVGSFGGRCDILFNVQRLSDETYEFIFTAIYKDNLIYMEYDHNDERLRVINRRLSLV